MAIGPDPIDEAMKESGVQTDVQQNDYETAPLYRIVGEKIPVSKHEGPLWETRYKQGCSASESAHEAWKEAIRYYQNDQTANRDSDADNYSRNRARRRKLGEDWVETENIVFANTTTLLPLLYSKNPTGEFTPAHEHNRELTTAYERLINQIIARKTSPGVNFKPKARRGVLTALLTNTAYMEIGWTPKQESSDALLSQLNECAKALEKAKTAQEIMDHEGKLIALEELFDVVNPEGPFCRIRSPFDVFIDPESSDPDLSDANWAIILDRLPTVYVNARYGKKDEEGKVSSVYEPTHVLRTQGSGQGDLESEINNFSLFTKDADFSKYGYKDKSSFDRACYTQVAWVWDKPKRRLMLFATNNWKWPLWVWADPLKLDRFFPIYPLHFHEDVDGHNVRGEVTYYLDQQDAINDIVSETNRARAWARRNIGYNANKVSKDQAEKMLRGPDGTAVGIDVPEGMKVEDLLFSIMPPSMSFMELFDPRSKYAAVDRISSVNSVIRAEQFRTNTTKKAVETYEQMTSIRIDEKIDAIEEWIGDIMWGLTQLCAMYMDSNMALAIVGPEVAAKWRNLSVDELRLAMHMRIQGGSTAKPNSQMKKREAIELAQVLGQFTRAAPAAVIVLMRVIERAWQGEISITEQDWAEIKQSMMMALTKAGSGPGGEGDGTPDEQARQAVRDLPPEGKQMLQQLIQQGMPPKQALQQVMQRLQQQQPQQPQTTH